MHDFFSFLGRLQGIFFPNLPTTPPPLKSQMVRPSVSFFVRNNTSGSSFKSISGAMSRKEASDFNWLSNQFDDRCCRPAKNCVALE